MAAAARLAARARPISRPNPGVATIIVKDGRVLSTGWTRAGGRPHAEADALAAEFARHARDLPEAFTPRASQLRVRLDLPEWED